LGRDTDIIALVGAGKGGHAILEALLRIPGIEVRYVFDADPSAPGIALARKNGIWCRTDGLVDELSADPDVDLIFEVTGKPEVFEALRASKHPNSSLLGNRTGHIRAIAPGTSVPLMRASRWCCTGQLGRPTAA